MASFGPAYELVSIAEGGYQNIAADTGNYNSLNQLVGTNWGINAQVYENYLGRPPTAADMRQMSKATARSIYRQRYWENIKGDQINIQAVANIFFDGHVNHGGWGIEMMQEVLGVARDRRVGPITLAAINSANPNDLIRRYADRRERSYRYLAAHREGYAQFLNGWLKRLRMFVNEQPGVAAAGGLTGLLLVGAGVWFLATK